MRAGDEDMSSIHRSVPYASLKQKSILLKGFGSLLGLLWLSAQDFHAFSRVYSCQFLIWFFHDFDPCFIPFQRRLGLFWERWANHCIKLQKHELPETHETFDLRTALWRCNRNRYHRCASICFKRNPGWTILLERIECERQYPEKFCPYCIRSCWWTLRLNT